MLKQVLRRAEHENSLCAYNEKTDAMNVCFLLVHPQGLEPWTP